tara:strand:+ start:422 stop:973 length:552 start_codon:yes stop_codon:yes gene_type:complete
MSINPRTIHVDPWSASATGSVYRDAPGMLRENGWAQPYTVCAGPLPVGGYVGSKRAICSGTGSTYLPLNGGESQSVLPILEAGQSLSIFSVQMTAACGGGDGSPCQVSLHVSGNGDTIVTDTQRMTVTGHKDGPFFQSFGLPMRVNGPAKVWINVDDNGSPSTAYSRFIINFIRVNEEDTIIP